MTEKKPSPLLKYAGGKRVIAPIVAELFWASGATCYCEPFLGAGAVALQVHLEAEARRVPIAIWGADASPWTGRWWRALTYVANPAFAVEEASQQVLEALSRYPEVLPEDRDARDRVYRSCRDAQNAVLDGAETDYAEEVARIWWINHACYNGLCRLNREGHYNVPAAPVGTRIGRPSSDDLHAALRLARGPHRFLGMGSAVELLRSVSAPPEQAFVYLDPPYLDTFDGYTGKGWTEDDLRSVLDAAVPFAEVLLSEHDSARVREVLGAGWEVVHRWARRGSINSDTTKRQPVPEAIYRRIRTKP